MRALSIVTLLSTFLSCAEYTPLHSIHTALEERLNYSQYCTDAQIIPTRSEEEFCVDQSCYTIESRHLATQTIPEDKVFATLYANGEGVGELERSPCGGERYTLNRGDAAPMRGGHSLILIDAYFIEGPRDHAGEVEFCLVPTAFLP